MKKGDLNQIKGILEERLENLRKEVVKEVPQSSNSALADVNDQATLETERNFELRIRDRERKLVAKIQKTLKNIDEGNYGECESCGEEIGVKRLLARPVTTFCINCKSEMEEDERREENLMSRGGNAFQ